MNLTNFCIRWTIFWYREKVSVKCGVWSFSSKI
uniref:Uncharacterized protein n=1 Tax=Schistosoma curassoni TaxID=6186 RepID=A0A183K6E4_9TREM